MNVEVIAKACFRTAEACRVAGISKNTYLRWVRMGVIPDVEYRDRRGWRIFTQEEIDRLKIEANRIHKTG